MTSSERYEIGSPVRCSDGECGELVCVVVDPVADRLAHLIVAPRGPRDSRLVPVESARVESGAIVLDLAREEFDRLEPAVKTHFLNAGNADDADGADEADERYGYRGGEIMYWPYFGLGPGRSVAGLGTPEPVLTSWVELEDRVPVGEVRVRRGERVHARDGRIGKIAGLVVDPADEAVTHILLDRGHLWGHKEVAIPIGAVGDITEQEVAVRLSKREIKELPPVDVAGLD
ncbi:MAG: hypothetical protein JF587_10165 [Catenulisporales bacterium]|nr:hypothetical protein [Catenulisporales bacterium]